jgi:hypothetical protein
MTVKISLKYKHMLWVAYRCSVIGYMLAITLVGVPRAVAD